MNSSLTSVPLPPPTLPFPRHAPMHPRTGRDKVEQYGWTMTDRPGRFQMLSKDTLLVDHLNYQREETLAQVNRLAREWSWMAFGVLLVARRPDGRLFVYEGQHRLAAALRRSDVSDVPCLVFDVTEIRQEASAFLKVNKNRRPPRGTETFRARVAEGDPAAKIVQDLLNQTGRVMTKSGGSLGVRCASLMTHHAEKRPDVLRRVWPLAHELCKGVPVHERILDALAYIEERMPEGESLQDRRWADRVLSVTYAGAIAACARFAAAYAKGGAKVWAEGLVDAMNKGRRNLLVIS